MPISRKMTKDKRVVTDFRYMCITKNNLAYPFLKDTFALLGSSQCEVMSVLDLKDAFHSLRLMENSKKYCGILPYFGSASYLYRRMPMGLNISPAIWQSYINVILDCLQSRKYCEVIMDDLLLFTPSKLSHFDKLEDLLKVLRKNGLKISPKKWKEKTFSSKFNQLIEVYKQQVGVQHYAINLVLFLTSQGKICKNV